jgi:hypothetical protein
MRKFPALPLAVLGLLSILVFPGCNSSDPGAHSISVTLFPGSSQTLNAAQSMLVTAAVAFDASNQGVSWTLNGQGTLSDKTAFTVTYVAPMGLTEAASVTVTATSLADSNAKTSLSITVNPFAVATTSLSNGTNFVPYTARLEAAGGVPPYTWSISSGSLPGWANLDSSTGVISGTPNITATSNFTVEATDSAGAPEIATQALSLTIQDLDATNNAELDGQYAFLLQGFDDATGNQFAMIGSLIADGNGKIASGLEDINGPNGYNTVTITGTYSVGGDNRGYVTFTDSQSRTHTFAIAVGGLNASNVATTASLIEFDDTTGTNGLRSTGSIYLQDHSSFNVASINGPYAFQTVGQTATVASRQVVTGAFTTDGKGNLTKGDTETVIGPAGIASHDAFTGSISTTANTSQFGRVTWEVTVPGGTGHSVSYTINSGHAFLMTTDPELTNGLMSGQVLAQKPDYLSSAALKGNSVYYLVGLGNPDGYVNAGLVTFDGLGGVTVAADANDSQKYSNQTISLKYSVAANGRTEFVDPANKNALVSVGYIVDKGTGFTMNVDTTAAAGFFEQQTGTTFSNASISGNYFLGTVAAAVTGSGVASGIGTSSGKGTLDFTVDTSHPMDLLTADQEETLKFTINKDTGRSPDTLGNFIIYVVSPKKVVVMNATSLWPTIMVLQK